MTDIPHYLESTVAENGSVQDELLLALAKGAEIEKLVAIKNKYDPANLFRFNQNIRPTATV